MKPENVPIERVNERKSAERLRKTRGIGHINSLIPIGAHLQLRMKVAEFEV